LREQVKGGLTYFAHGFRVFSPVVWSHALGQSIMASGVNGTAKFFPHGGQEEHKNTHTHTHTHTHTKRERVREKGRGQGGDIPRTHPQCPISF
jgi:hypothetical protein